MRMIMIKKWIYILKVHEIVEFHDVIKLYFSELFDTYIDKVAFDINVSWDLNLRP